METTLGVGHGNTGSGAWKHRDWGMGTHEVRHGDIGSGVWGHRDWGVGT